MHDELSKNIKAYFSNKKEVIAEHQEQVKK
jgi:hypothetical protein